MSGVLLLRADAGSEIGVGHLMRCLALAEAWTAAGGEAHLLGDVPDALAPRLAASGVALAERRPGTPRGSAADGVHTAAVARARGADWIVADGYAFGGSWQGAARAADARLGVLDDHGQLDAHEVDLLLDQNLDADAAMYGAAYADCAPHARRLLGSRYALLRREFAGRPASRPVDQPAVDAAPASRAVRLLVTMGGSDPGGLSALALDAVARLDGPALDVRLVVGAANPRADALRATAAKVRPHRVTVTIDAPAMRPHMEWADLALAAAGSTCWELAYLGVPSVLLVAAENQRAIAERLAAHGAAVRLAADGVHEAPTAAALAGALGALAGAPALRRRMSAAAAALVDGQGARRVVAALADRAA